MHAHARPECSGGAGAIAGAAAPPEDDLAALGEEIAASAALLDAATYALLGKLRRFDEGEGWLRQGAMSCAHWLSWRTGLDPATCREQVRVARALAALPAIDAAFRRGEVSYSKVRAMTRVATAECEETLCALAREATAAQLERICRLFRGAREADAAAAREQELRRGVRQRDTADGMVVIQARLLPEEAARVMAAIGRSAELLGVPPAGAAEAADVSAETSREPPAQPPPSRPPGGAALADGLVAMAEAVLRGDRPERAPVEVVVHVQAGAGAGGEPVSIGPGELADGTGLAPAVARRLGCDAGVVVIEENERGEALDIGRKRRTVTGALKRALFARDRGCCFPGCCKRRFVAGHHLVHWADGGETSLGNLVLLCAYHHRAVHEGGFRIVRAPDGTLTFFDPRGVPVPPHPDGRRGPLPAEPALRRHAEELGWAVGPERNAPRWDGEPVDYALAVEALFAAAPA